MMKRIIDLAVSGLALIVLSPFLAVVWIVVRASSPGPGVYVQTRVGFQGKIFRIFKFRTMAVNADCIGSYQTQDNDSRITQVGRVLRKTSIDELPQLFNVLRGDMSLVGPRPDTPMQESRYENWQWTKRLSVRPGMTGLAQATRRSLANHDERLHLDFEYIDTQSIWLDLKILWLTFGKLSGKGSN